MRSTADGYGTRVGMDEGWRVSWEWEVCEKPKRVGRSGVEFIVVTSLFQKIEQVFTGDELEEKEEVR